MKKGIDVSTHQGIIDWSKVKASGVEFAILRAGFGNSVDQTDKQFHANAKGATAVGIDIGVYWFSYACNEEEARTEARACLEVVKPYKLTYPIAFDFEGDSANYAIKKGSVINKQTVTTMAKAFCDEVRRAGYYPILYTNLDYIRNYYDMDVLSDVDVWLAQYNSENTYSGKTAIWQYSSTGKVDGINGNVDMNNGYVDYPEIIKDGGYNGFSKPVVNPVPVPTPEPVPVPQGCTYTVKSGDTLSGIAVKYGISWSELYNYGGNRAVIGNNPNVIRVGQVLDVPSQGGADVPKEIKPGVKVSYSGRLYGDSYGGSAGATVSGVFEVQRYIPDRKCGVLLPAGWAETSGCKLV